MKRKDKISFNADCIISYKQSIQPLYIKWSRQYSADEIRCEYVRWVMDHFINHEKDKLRKRIKRKLHKKLSKVMSPLEEKQLEHDLGDDLFANL